MKKSTKPYILKLRKYHIYIHFEIEEAILRGKPQQCVAVRSIRAIRACENISQTLVAFIK